MGAEKTVITKFDNKPLQLNSFQTGNALVTIVFFTYTFIIW